VGAVGTIDTVGPQRCSGLGRHGGATPAPTWARLSCQLVMKCGMLHPPHLPQARHGQAGQCAAAAAPPCATHENCMQSLLPPPSPLPRPTPSCAGMGMDSRLWSGGSGSGGASPHMGDAVMGVPGRVSSGGLLMRHSNQVGAFRVRTRV